MNVREQLEGFHHNREWLEKYLGFVNESPSPPAGKCHRHHILPRRIYPEFESFEKCPWNRKDLNPADHLTAHYLLFRALLGDPKVEPKVSTAFFWMIVTALAVPDYNDAFIRELAARYQAACESGARFPWAERNRPSAFIVDASDL